MNSKQPSDLCAAISKSWIADFGVPECIISDREGGIASEYASIWSERRGTSIRLKAVGQHAPVVERHDELLVMLSTKA